MTTFAIADGFVFHKGVNAGSVDPDGIVTFGNAWDAIAWEIHVMTEFAGVESDAIAHLTGGTP